MNQQLYKILLLVLVVASYFHIQPIVLGISGLIIFLPLNRHFAAIKAVKWFALLMAPVFLAIVISYNNSNYLIFKDAYYFSMPVFFILSGIVLACRMDIENFLKTLVYAGAITSLIVTGISVYYVGVSSISDPYSAHYAVGIVGTPGPPVALACLLLTKKFNIRLFSRGWFNLFVLINCMGIYMFASRTYLIITLCFLLMLVADKVKRKWVLPVIFFLIVLVIVFPFDIFKANTTGNFADKILGSFNELSIGNYNTEEEINTKYRGYESFMAINQYINSGTKEWIFGSIGNLIDLKTFVRLGEDTDYRFIPVLHNGWLYLLVKTGIVGILTYFIVFFRLVFMNWKKYADTKSKPVIKLFAALAVGCILSLFLTNYIVTALFNVEMSIVMITLGYSYLNFKSLVFKVEERERMLRFDLVGSNILQYEAAGN